MRNAPGKKLGYVILPVVIPANMEPHEALNNNKIYGVVWQVLQALRSHDDRFDALVNKLDLIGQDSRKMEVIAITDTIQKKQRRTGSGTDPQNTGRGGYGIGQAEQGAPLQGTQGELEFEIGDIERAIYAKLVKKVGNRHHWEAWAQDIAKIAQTHITRITSIVQNPGNHEAVLAFRTFASELREDLNSSITDTEIIEMLAQHLITKPVFDALFSGHSFTDHNPISQAMQGVLGVLEAHHLEKETTTLEKFYASVHERARGIDTAAGKQKIILELYDKFFRHAFPQMAERLGIVYTPVEVVDFILHSVSHLLKTEFGLSLGSPGVHILDPFTGTGTFIARLLQSGLIAPDDLAAKYQSGIHANEIVLLAYYIAAINIETTYHAVMGNHAGHYQPFQGICLTDTFQLYEKKDLVERLLLDNNARRKRQQGLDVRVIVGNPPYSAGQDSANDNNQNVAYPDLDERIRKTYARRTRAVNKNTLYDSYIRAIRWASDRIGNSGVIGFVTNAGFLDSASADGLRLCLAEEFSSMYVFHLRGNQRTSGELSRKEVGKIFGSGSRAPIAISLLVKNPEAQQPGQIFYHDIGDYLSRENKLEKIDAFNSIAGLSHAAAWHSITPDAHGDWLKQRDDGFANFMVLGDKQGDATKVFENFSRGVVTARDAWCYSPDRASLADNMTRMIGFYNTEVDRFALAFAGQSKAQCEAKLDAFIDPDATCISWTRALKQELIKGRHFAFEAHCLTRSLYRPFTKQWLYFNRRFNEMVYQMPRIFPDGAAENLVICVSGVGAKNFSVLATDNLPCLDNIEKGQCFPLYLYDIPEAPTQQTDLFTPKQTPSPPTRRDAITDTALAHFQAAYPSHPITKPDIFYYIYGLLHSPDYRARYGDNLAKELPRIPCVQTALDFQKFSQAGRALAALHVDYDQVTPYPLTLQTAGKELSDLTDEHYRVTKMQYSKVGKQKDKTSVIYNPHITLTGIPLAAYDYVVNGKPAIDWVLERQCVKTDKASIIVNDANLWALHTMHNPRYPLELLQRVVTVSLETLNIVQALPALA
jgi:predicted helicase